MADIKLGYGIGIKATLLTPAGAVCDLRDALYVNAVLTLPNGSTMYAQDIAVDRVTNAIYVRLLADRELTAVGNYRILFNIKLADGVMYSTVAVNFANVTTDADAEYKELSLSFSLEVTDYPQNVERTGASPKVSSRQTWLVYNDEAKAYEDTGIPAEVNLGDYYTKEETDEKVAELESDAKSTDDFIGKNDITDSVNYINNVFISLEGQLVSNNTCKVSSPIFLKKGETISVYVGGNSISAIAKTDEQASFYRLIVPAKDDTGATKFYSYTSAEDMYVAVGGIYVNGFGIYKVNTISSLVKMVESLLDNTKQELSDTKQELSDTKQELENILSTNNINLSDNLFLGESQRVYGKMVLYTETNNDVYLGDLDIGKCYRILLTNNTTYYLPHSSGLFGNAYNFLVAGDDEKAYPTLKFGGYDGFLIGDDITKIDNYLSFTSPAEGNNYLFINLEYIPSGTNVVDKFYLTSNPDYVKVVTSYNEISYKGIFITLSDFISFFIKTKREINERIDSLKFETGNAFNDKVIYVLGDSITWLGGDNCDGVQGQYSHQGWTEYVKNRLNPKKMKSYARSGATLSCYTTSTENTSAKEGSPSATNILWNQVIRMANDIKNGAEKPDYILIAAGCNDAYIYESETPSFQELHLAAQNFLADEVDAVMTSGINTSWYGSKTPSECSSIARTLRWMKDAFISICPDVQVILMTPLQSHYSTLATQRQVAERMEECAMYLSWNTINQGKECGISRLQESKGYHYTYDGTHTSALGANQVGAIIAKRLTAMLGV